MFITFQFHKITEFSTNEIIIVTMFQIKYFKNIYEINIEKLKEQGIKCLMFDLDSTVMVSK